MFGGPIKLGIAAAVGYAFGGRIGSWALEKVDKTAGPDAITGAQWGGRVALFLVTATVLAKGV